MNKYTTLFEQQSYQDALSYFLETLEDQELPVWDYVILTASNEAQANAYQIQLEHRLKKNQLPLRTHYALIPDRNGQRIGSGGAPTSCIRHGAGGGGRFSGPGVRVIHCGCDSQRVPQ